MKSKVISFSDIVKNNFSLSPKDYLDKDKKRCVVIEETSFTMFDGRSFTLEEGMIFEVLDEFKHDFSDGTFNMVVIHQPHSIAIAVEKELVRMLNGKDDVKNILPRKVLSYWNTSKGKLYVYEQQENALLVGFNKKDTMWLKIQIDSIPTEEGENNIFFVEYEGKKYFDDLEVDVDEDC